ncbi:hypothetical protein H6F93_02000 [Leptolyngbya sp. FACHB-671]|uniref:hypothetical protein n=1 Tax=Leptolyngbya sp. FACHB-671 TaxID=2692812 RepID=UPI0016853221|nr:hypothetical protein [Leptolyngbya sp. FACHB-671]MBD2066310.1 hypothetical protein [Leptolyngbya sp. FACHB-671]
MTFPNPETVVKHVIRLMGGHEEARQKFDADFRYITTCWEQDTTTIGRILASHLFVEHFLTEYVQAKNPQLGSLAEAHISFSQKVALVGTGEPGTDYLLPGIRRLNKIRNRIAHTLRAEVTEDDANAFLQIELFQSLRTELARTSSTPSVPSTDPIIVLEDFAKHAGSSLHASIAPFADIWAKAFRAAEEDLLDAQTP